MSNEELVPNLPFEPIADTAMRCAEILMDAFENVGYDEWDESATIRVTSGYAYVVFAKEKTAYRFAKGQWLEVTDEASNYQE